MEERKKQGEGKRFGPLARLIQRRDLVNAAVGSVGLSLVQPVAAVDPPPPGPALGEAPKPATPPAPKKEEPKKEEPKKEEPKKEEPKKEEPKKEEPKKEEPKKEEPKKEEPKKEEPKKEEPKKEAPPAPKKEEPKKDAKKIDIGDLRDENFNSDLLKQIEDMRDRRDDMSLKIIKYEEDAAKLRKDIASRNSRLSKLESLIAARTKQRADLDKDISEAETDLFKLLETSSGLLEKLKRKLSN